MECAGTDNAAEVRKLDIALETPRHVDRRRSSFLGEISCAAVARGDRSATSPNLHRCCVEKDGEPTDLNVYTVFDGTVFDESIPGDKLKYLNFRHEKLTAAIEAGTSSGAFAELLQKAVEMEATLAVERSAEGRQRPRASRRRKRQG